MPTFFRGESENDSPISLHFSYIFKISFCTSALVQCGPSTMYSQLCIGSFCVQQFFSKGEGAEKLLKYKFSWKLFS